MKNSKPKTYGNRNCRQCSKKFIKTNYHQKYCSKECVSEVRKKLLEKYRKTDKRKKVLKRYSQSDALKKYLQSDKYKNKQKKYKQSNKGKKATQKSNKIYSQSDNGKDAAKKSFEIRRKTDLIFRLILTCRSRLTKILKLKNMKKTNTTFEMIGCTPRFLKEYLEKQFKPGMTWKNHTLKGWHIDHKIPLASAKTQKSLKKLMHYTNTRPMWASENIKKGNRII
jgi:hypothetical protein